MSTAVGYWGSFARAGLLRAEPEPAFVAQVRRPIRRHRHVHRRWPPASRAAKCTTGDECCGRDMVSSVNPPPGVDRRMDPHSHSAVQRENRFGILQCTSFRAAAQRLGTELRDTVAIADAACARNCGGLS
jgi:hypothetical protein